MYIGIILLYLIIYIRIILISQWDNFDFLGGKRSAVKDEKGKY